MQKWSVPNDKSCKSLYIGVIKHLNKCLRNQEVGKDVEQMGQMPQ